TVAARNVISGNGTANVSGDGVNITGSSATGNVVAGNYVGTNAAGTAAIANAFNGVRIANSASGNTVGGTTAGAGNVLSGNTLNGVLIQTSAATNTVQGNLVGTNAAGTAAVPNLFAGVNIFGPGGSNTIGGATAAARNVISGNTGHGVIIQSSSLANTIKGNYIGVAADGTTALGNTGTFGRGITVAGSSHNNQIGGAAAGEGNVIANNAAHGIVVGSSSNGIAVRGNSIHSNTGLGIDLNDGVVTANDAGDADTGGNNLQNFPVLTSATTSAGTTTVAGTLDSTPNATFRVEFFSNPACDSSGNGEGQVFLGADAATTDGAGAASFSTPITFAATVGHVVTATATNTATGDTSEFSACLPVTDPPAGTVQFDAATYTAGEGAGTVTVNVTRTGGSFGAVTVSYASTPGTATAPADYASASGSVTFADGDAAAKSFTVAVADDALDEADETFTLTLSVTSGAATLGTPSAATVTVTDDDPPPSISVGDVALNEGNSGQSSAVFQISLSAASGLPVSVNFATADGAATAASGDYAAQSGTAALPAGTTTFSLSVPVNGDTDFEEDETFFLDLSSPTNATIADARAQATITNDDGVPTFNVSGQVNDSANGQPLAGVTLALSGAQSGATQTDASGNYTFASLPAGGTYTVTPSLANYGFAPPSRTFADLQANQAADFTASLLSHTVSGRVTDAANNPLQGATITLSGLSAATAQTDAAGNYSFANVPAGGNYAVTPSLANYTFAPPSRTFTNLAADATGDFTATLDTFTISGRVADALNAPLADATITLAGAASRTAQTDASGNYTFAALSAGGNYTVTPAKTGYAFTPPSRSVDNLTADRTADFTARISVVTPAGSTVAVTTPAGTFTFAQVSGAGVTTVTPTNPAAAGAAPQGYSFLPGTPSVDISTTATTSGAVSVCLSVPTVSDPVIFAGLRLLHGEGGLLVDRTSSSDFPTRTICALAPSLSPFVVAFAQPATITGRATDPNGGALPGVAVTLGGAQSA
ncbi:MAG TPA: carboxypeptidase regulatory-like domain-containing protein, partial [Pyrinomonadaceae bacterium]|nr:carboxypeptidase regulatory-like domain-containing protein [Pyrinomonadaceae bacterium]